MKRMIPLLWLAAIACLVFCSLKLFKTTYEGAIPEPNNSSQVTPIDSPPQSISKLDIYTQAAIETCLCIQPMLEKAKHLKELETNKQTTSMKKVANEMAQIQPQIQKCSDELRQKYRKINNALDQQRILNALRIECPDMATLFSNLANVVNN